MEASPSFARKLVVLSGARADGPSPYCGCELGDPLPITRSKAVSKNSCINIGPSSLVAGPGRSWVCTCLGISFYRSVPAGEPTETRITRRFSWWPLYLVLSSVMVFEDDEVLDSTKKYFVWRKEQPHDQRILLTAVGCASIRNTRPPAYTTAPSYLPITTVISKGGATSYRKTIGPDVVHIMFQPQN